MNRRDWIAAAVGGISVGEASRLDERRTLEQKVKLLRQINDQEGPIPLTVHGYIVEEILQFLEGTIDIAINDQGCVVITYPDGRKHVCRKKTWEV